MEGRENNVMTRARAFYGSESDMEEYVDEEMMFQFMSEEVHYETVQPATDDAGHDGSSGRLPILYNNSNTNTSLGIGEGMPSSVASSSSSYSSGALVRGDHNDDPLNKQPKAVPFQIFVDRDCQHSFTTITDVEDCNMNVADHRFANCFSKETITPSLMFDGSKEGYIYSSGGRNDAVDGSDDLGSEDFINRSYLPDDLLHKVFSLLKNVDIFRVGMVCQQWRTVSSHEDFWRFLNFEELNITLEQFKGICQRYPNATKVNIYGCPTIQSSAMIAVSSLRNLDTLTLGKGHFGETFYQALTNCPTLRNLIISDAILGYGNQDMLIFHDRLRHLQIVRCHVLRISVRCPQLETLSLKRSTVSHAVLNCPLLIDLDMASCCNILDADIRSTVISCPLLESLDMSSCLSVTNATLRELEHNCANLHILNASYCPKISLELVRLPALTVLKLHSCEGITSASMTSLAHSPMLEVLELDNCNSLASLTLDHAHLQKLRLVHCRNFADLNLCSVMLTSITVSNCPSLKQISLTSNLLQKLVLQKEEKLATLALQCQCLEEVDLTYCESLTNSIFDVFSDGGGCPMLKSLILDNCKGLTAAVFHNSSLVNLSLIGCQALTSLQLTCAHLENVSFDGCDHLEKASFYSVGLKSLNLGICPKLSLLQIEAPNIQLLDLKGCGVLSEASINCSMLNSLDASFCSQLKDDCLSATIASSPLIETLVLVSCQSIGPDGLSSVCFLSQLTSLDLSYTLLVSLQPVFESCLNLKVLKLLACKFLTNSSLKPLYKGGALPKLCELDLSYGSLSQSAIDELLASCTHLTHLSLNGCANMNDLNWGFSGSCTFDSCMLSFGSSSSSSNAVSLHNGSRLSNLQPNRLLQNLNCVGCPNIKKVFIPPTVCCLHLSSLNLSLSSYLREVDVACLNLCSLNLSNCCSLEVLKLDCPKLASLSLQWCNVDEEMVATAVSGCGILETLDVRFCPKIYSIGMMGIRAACPSLKRVYSSSSISCSCSS